MSKKITNMHHKVKSNFDSQSDRTKELEQEKIIMQEITDILENKQSINQDILDSLSHEFRTPLSIIKTLIDLLVAEEYGTINAKQKEKLLLVQQNTAQLIDEIFKILMKKNEN